jgi:mannose-1-phosphate guanylyltransferase
MRLLLLALNSLEKFPNYVFEPRALDYVPEGTFFDFARDVFPKFLENGERFVGYQGDFYWSDIGALEAYRVAQYDVLSGKVKVRIPGKKRGKSLWVGEDAQIHPSATIDGHVLVRRDAVVGRDVTLSGDVTVGSECWIGPNATIKRSILLPGASVGDGAYIEDCIVGHALQQQRRYDVRPGERFRGGALFRSPTERRGSR